MKKLQIFFKMHRGKKKNSRGWGEETKFLTGCTVICTQPVTISNNKRHHPYVNINPEVSPLGLLLFILVSHQNTPALTQEIFFPPKW